MGVHDGVAESHQNAFESSARYLRAELLAAARVRGDRSRDYSLEVRRIRHLLDLGAAHDVPSWILEAAIDDGVPASTVRSWCGLD